jgi:hypothetical protein
MNYYPFRHDPCVPCAQVFLENYYNEIVVCVNFRDRDLLRPWADHLEQKEF